MPTFLNNPLLRIPLLIWDAANAITTNYLDALRFYHEVCASMLELLNGAPVG